MERRFVGISDRRPRQIPGVVWGQDLVEQVQEAARSTQPPLQVEVERWPVDFGALQLEADAKVALVFARRMGTITNEQLRRLRPLDREASRETLQDLVARGLLEAFGRGRGTGYRLSALAMEAPSTATLGEQLIAVLNHARWTGVVVNSEVRGLLGVGAPEARTILEALVLRGLLQPEGERRGRRYLPVRQPEDEA